MSLRKANVIYMMMLLRRNSGALCIIQIRPYLKDTPLINTTLMKLHHRCQMIPIQLTLMVPQHLKSLLLIIQSKLKRIYLKGKNQVAKVIGLTKEPNGDTVIKYNYNTLFNSMLYDVEFPDGEIK